MDTLFVIGNGFDCYRHNLPTKYSDFRKYLINRFPNAKIINYVPTSTLLPDGGEEYDEDEIVGYILNIIDLCEGETWANLEECLGNEIFGSMEEEFFDIDMDEEDNTIWQNIFNNEDTSVNVRNVFERIKHYFTEWVNEELDNLDYDNIEDANVNKIFKQSAALFLSFNYTRLLEDVYGIDDTVVCHIHGECGMAEEDIFFGHGNEEEFTETNYAWGAENSLNELKTELKKDTWEAYSRHKEFFDRLNTVKKIYSYGFSFSDVDMFYIKTIAERVNLEDTVWYFDSYAWNNNKGAIEKVRSAGFKVSLFDWDR